MCGRQDARQVCDAEKEGAIATAPGSSIMNESMKG